MKLTTNDVLDALARVKPKKPIPVGIVCRPDAMRRLKAKVAKTAAPHPATVLDVTFAGFPLHERADQLEPFRVFYDRKKLDEYLKQPLGTVLYGHNCQGQARPHVVLPPIDSAEWDKLLSGQDCNCGKHP